MSKLLVTDEAFWLPLPKEALQRLLEESNETLGWKLRDFVQRAVDEMEAAA